MADWVPGERFGCRLRGESVTKIDAARGEDQRLAARDLPRGPRVTAKVIAPAMIDTDMIRDDPRVKPELIRSDVLADPRRSSRSS
jgi:hypothetical protein